MSVGTVGDVSVAVFNDVVSVVISGANCWKEQRVLMSVSLNECTGCWRVIRFIIVFVVFFVLLLIVISITDFK